MTPEATLEQVKKIGYAVIDIDELLDLHETITELNKELDEMEPEARYTDFERQCYEIGRANIFDDCFSQYKSVGHSGGKFETKHEWAKDCIYRSNLPEYMSVNQFLSEFDREITEQYFKKLEVAKKKVEEKEDE